MLTLEIHHTGGLYAQRLIHYFRSRGGHVEDYEAPRNLPMIIDEPEEYLPANAGHGDVVIAVHMHQDLVVELPDLMAVHGGKALIVPVEDPDWARPGLVRQVGELCRGRGLECEFPKPFCALNPQGPVLKRFADEYEVGKPELILTQRDGRVVGAECKRGAPCGLTAAAAGKLVGTDLSHECTRSMLPTLAWPP